MRNTDVEPDVRSYAVTHRGGTFELPHDPNWSTLVYASRGVLTITTPDGAWVVPPQRAVHVEAGIVPEVTVRGTASMRVLYLRVPLAVDGAGCAVVDVSPLLRELILRMVAAAPLALHRPHDRDLVAVFSHEIGSVRADSVLRLPVPTNPRLRVFADILVAELSRPRPVVAVARDCGFGMRTLERMFLADTGLTIGQWRRRMRMLEGLRLLADRTPVTTVAGLVGYATPSAFGAAFRAELGTSPARYFDAGSSRR